MVHDLPLTKTELRDHTVRPEQQAGAEIYYNVAESQKYHFHKHTVNTQLEMTKNAIDLLHLSPGPKLALDIGCGSGISGMTLTEEGHTWIGCDISLEMLNIANQRPVRDYDLIAADMGQNLNFRPGTFDFAVSISALQWLCYAHKKEEDPYKRLLCFFKWLRECLNATGKAVIQFYPEHDKQTEMIRETCLKSGFTAGLVEDKKSEDSKKRKLYLILAVGTLLDPTMTDDAFKKQTDAQRKTRFSKQLKNVKGKQNKKSRDWIIKKKEQQRSKQGEENIRPDSKYTGRRRKRF